MSSVDTLSKRVCVMMADGCEEVEALAVCDLLWRAGIDCVKVALGHERTVTSAHNIRFECDITLQDPTFSFENFDAIVLPGGMPGTLNLEASELLCAALRDFAGRDDKYLAAICAAPSIFAHLALLEGKQATSYPSFQEQLAQAGADVCSEATVIQDGRIITSQGAGTVFDFAYQLICVLASQEKAQEVARSIVDLNTRLFD